MCTNIFQFHTSNTIRKEIYRLQKKRLKVKKYIFYFMLFPLLIHLSAKEKSRLRWYLQNGGFLFADDNFGMDPFIRKELNSLFPNVKLTTNV